MFLHEERQEKLRIAENPVIVTPKWVACANSPETWRITFPNLQKALAQHSQANKKLGQIYLSSEAVRLEILSSAQSWSTCIFK